MNYYFLLEDSESFIKILPKWLEYMKFPCERVADIKEVKERNYILQSGHGVTQLITKALFDTIETIRENQGKIDKLVVILDSEELDVAARREQVYQKIDEKYGKEELDFAIVVLVTNHCFETWLLGRVDLYPKEPVDEGSFFYPYYSHYNIEKGDPEYMSVPENLDDSIATYHFHYLHELLRYKKIRYRKSNPRNVGTIDYFNGLLQRINDTVHMQSFREFYDFIQNEKNYL